MVSSRVPIHCGPFLPLFSTPRAACPACNAAWSSKYRGSRWTRSIFCASAARAAKDGGRRSRVFRVNLMESWEVKISWPLWKTAGKSRYGRNNVPPQFGHTSFNVGVFKGFFKGSMSFFFFKSSFVISLSSRNFHDVSWKPSPTTPEAPPPKKKNNSPSLSKQKKKHVPPFPIHPSSKSRIFPWSHIFFQLQPLVLCFLQPSHGIFQLFLHPQDLRAFAPGQIHLGPTKAADGQIQGLPRRRRGGRHGGTTRLGDRWNGNEERIHGYLVGSLQKEF